MPRGKMVVTDEQIIEQFRDADDPALTAKEVSEDLAFTRQAANNRLQDLVEEGRVCRKKAGPSVIYWLPD